MNSAAILLGSVAVTWNAVFAALGAACALLVLLALWLAEGRDPAGMGVFFLASALFSLVLGRLGHWYSHPLLYADFRTAMTLYRAGGFSLSGVFAGTLLSALLCRAAGLIRPLRTMLDALSPAAAFGLALGRLGSLADLSDRGRFVLSSPAFQRLPFAALTGGDWRFATFMFQSMVCALLGAALLALLRKKRWEGQVFCLFLLFYSAAEIVLDSTRYDADFFRFNGFIHMGQILCLALLLGAAAGCSVRSVRKNGLRGFHWICWGLIALGCGVSGWMEYFVQRRPDRFALAYTVMSLGMLLAALAGAGLASFSGAKPPVRPAERPAAPEEASAGIRAE